MRVTFVNVCQGDCTLLHGDGSPAVLIDAGTKSNLEQSRVALIKARAPTLTRVVGTHYDQDHLSGLKKIVEEYGGLGIEAAVLPPVLDPARRGSLVNARVIRAGAMSPWLAEVLLAEGLARTVSRFLAIERPPEAEVGETEVKDARDVVDNSASLSQREVSELSAEQVWEAGERSGPDRVVDMNLLDPEIVEQAAVMLAEALRDDGRQADQVSNVLEFVARVAQLQSPEAWWQLQLLVTADQELFVVARVAEALIVSATMNSLVAALEEQGIPWFTPIAPDTSCEFPFWSEAELLPGYAAAHLAPTAQHLGQVWGRLPFLAERTPGQKGRAISNEISHVFAIWPNRYRCLAENGLLLTGDSDMRELRDDSHTAIACCSLIDISHHGGKWGMFPARLVAACTTSQSPIPRAASLDLYVSIAKKRPKGGPPGEGQLDDLLTRLAGALPGAPLRLWANNRQPGALMAWKTQPCEDGADALTFWRSPAGWVPAPKGPISS